MKLLLFLFLIASSRLETNAITIKIPEILTDISGYIYDKLTPNFIKSVIPSPEQLRRYNIQFSTDEYSDEHLGSYKPSENAHLFRPIPFAPYSRERIATKFTLFTSANKDAHNKLLAEVISNSDVETAKKSHFRKGQQVVFIVHGFVDNGELQWVQDLTKALIDAHDVNVIVVDWSGGNFFPYFQATVNTWVVGGEIWLMYKMLVENDFSITYNNVHIIGHSLGAHIAGLAGARSNGQIGRITGLDPAAPLFFNYASSAALDEKFRLDPTDAQFVDVIHTDGGIVGLGLRVNVGHLDFYPNEGKAQPKCNVTWLLSAWHQGLDQASRDFFACSHSRSIAIFTESLSTQCPFIAHQCTSFADYMRGKCTACGSQDNECARVGYDSVNHPTKTTSVARMFFFTTAPGNPFCYFHYSVAVVLDQDHDECGAMRMTLETPQGSRAFVIEFNGAETGKKGSSYKRIIGDSTRFTSVTRASITWDRERCTWRSLPGLLRTFRMDIKRIEVQLIDTLTPAEPMKVCDPTPTVAIAGDTYSISGKNCP